MIKRRISRVIHIGGVKVGGGAPVSVQSMTKTDTRNVAATVSQIKELEECGCEIIRVAVPDTEAAEAISKIDEISNDPNMPIHARTRIWELVSQLETIPLD